MENTISPQEGKQTEFLSCTADIVFYGGAAGGGKSYAILLEATRNIAVPNYGAVIFRRELTQITRQGSLWDTAEDIYPQIGGRGVKGNVLTFYWDEYKTKINFAYLARDSNLRGYQGTQIPFIGFDELTHFSKRQFFFMLSRNRSVCGVKPYIRATTNPDPDSWVRNFIDWWIDKDGYAIEERSGVVRWFVNSQDELFWFASEEDALKSFPKSPPKSFTFIKSSLEDNKILMEADPGYQINLNNLPKVERERLKLGNWNIRPASGDYFSRGDFEIVDAYPHLKKIVRCWDFAATTPSDENPDPDWTVGMKMGKDADGVLYLLDIYRRRIPAPKVRKTLDNIGNQDGKSCYIRIPIDPGSAGKVVAEDLIRMMQGSRIKGERVTGSKESRAEIASAQASIGNIKIMRAAWNDAFLNEVESFPLGKHDDQVDTLSDCVKFLAKKTTDFAALI